MVGKKAVNFSNVWKKGPGIFQGLEKRPEKFPTLGLVRHGGENAEIFSNIWKKGVDFFQSLDLPATAGKMEDEP